MSRLYLKAGIFSKLIKIRQLPGHNRFKTGFGRYGDGERVGTLVVAVVLLQHHLYPIIVFTFNFKCNVVLS